MCHHVYVKLSAEEKKEAKRLSGFLVPVYASIVLAVIAIVAASSAPQQGDQIASRTLPAVRH
jgi:hypothetical protein